MNTIAQRIAPGPQAPGRMRSLLGIAAALALTTVAAASVWPMHPAVYLSAWAPLAAGYLAHDARCRARPPRVRSLAGFLWAPTGRIRHIPVDTPLLAAKRYHFYPSQAYRPMRVWIGWWNCRTFTGDPASEEYVFFRRRTTRFAIPARDLVPAG